FCFVFFSSRRRHTRSKRDWSSDVCSSDLVLGGGVIGSEFASAWNSYGGEVTIIEGLDSLVPNEDPAIIKQLTRHFRRAGIKSNLGVFFEKVEETADG